jgi:phosphoglycerate dehydrogenase-like enzyme
MKILVLDHLGETFCQSLQQDYPEHQFILTDFGSNTEDIRDAEIVLGTVNSQSFCQARKLRWIHTPFAGIDWIQDVPELIASDVILTNARFYHAAPMANYVMGMILTFAHRLHEYWQDQKDHVWNRDKYENKLINLQDSNIGILGFGAIGRAVARRAAAFDMNIYAIELHPKTTPDYVRAVWSPDRLDEVMQLSDWFVVAAPRTKLTWNLIGKNRVSQFKSGCHVIVVSRGGIVTEEALLAGLESSRLAGAAIDDFEQYPPDVNHPLWNHKNVLVSPHASSDAYGLWDQRRQLCRENLKRYLNNQKLLNICDKQAGF